MLETAARVTAAPCSPQTSRERVISLQLSSALHGDWAPRCVTAWLTAEQRCRWWRCVWRNERLAVHGVAACLTLPLLEPGAAFVEICRG